MDKFTLVLPWPDPKLSPNARLHYREKAQHIAEAREQAFFLAHEQDNGWRPGPGDKLETRLIFQPPDKRRRDVDNLLSSSKGYLDGVFQALGVDDSRVRRTVLEFGAAALFGAVMLEIRSIEPAWDTTIKAGA